MSLHEQIKGEIKKSMMARDTVRLEVMRGLTTAFMNELVSTGRTPQDMLTDEEALKVITRSAKQRKDSIEQFTAGGRMDLVEEEKPQLAILEEYLPKLMEKSEVEKIVQDKIEELKNAGTLDLSGKGLFMAGLMKDLKGKADGALVKQIVDELFK